MAALENKKVTVEKEEKRKGVQKNKEKLMKWKQEQLAELDTIKCTVK